MSSWRNGVENNLGSFFRKDPAKNNDKWAKAKDSRIKTQSNYYNYLTCQLYPIKLTWKPHNSSRLLTPSTNLPCFNEDRILTLQEAICSVDTWLPNSIPNAACVLGEMQLWRILDLSLEKILPKTTIKVHCGGGKFLRSFLSMKASHYLHQPITTKMVLPNSLEKHTIVNDC